MEVFKFDIERLTLGELEEVEEITGQAFGDLFGEGKTLRAKALRAFAYVMKKRDNPDYTYEQTYDLVIDYESDPKEQSGTSV